MNKLDSHQLLVVTLGSLHFGNGTRNGKLEEHPKHTVSRKLLEQFSLNLISAFQDKIEVGIEFPNEKNRNVWGKCFKQQEDGTFVCKRSRLNIVWNAYREMNIFYPMALVRRVLYNTMCQVNGYAEEDYDAF